MHIESPMGSCHISAARVGAKNILIEMGANELIPAPFSPKQVLKMFFSHAPIFNECFRTEANRSSLKENTKEILLWRTCTVERERQHRSTHMGLFHLMIC